MHTFFYSFFLRMYNTKVKLTFTASFKFDLVLGLRSPLGFLLVSNTDRLNIITAICVVQENVVSRNFKNINDWIFLNNQYERKANKNVKVKDISFKYKPAQLLVEKHTLFEVFQQSCWGFQADSAHLIWKAHAWQRPKNEQTYYMWSILKQEDVLQNLKKNAACT